MLLKFAKVGEHRHGRIAAVDADNAPAGMRACPAEVDPGHGCPRSEPIRPHIRWQAFALKDVATGQADFLFDVRRAEHLGIDYGGVDV